MKCVNHTDMDAVATCQVCGKGLCGDCADKWSEPLCDDCVIKDAKKNKMESIAKLAIIVVGVAAICIFMLVMKFKLVESFVLAFILMGIPFGWLGISKLENRLLSGCLFGGLLIIVRLIVKFILAYVVGWIFEIYEIGYSSYTIYKSSRMIKFANQNIG